MPNESSTPRSPAPAPAFETLAVHGGREDFHELGVHAPPLDLSTTYPVTGVEAAAASLDALAAGGVPRDGQAVYARLHNPTVDRFERALAGLENAEHAVSFASGMAALTACLLAARQVVPTDGAKVHVVAVRPIYGGSDHLLDGDLLGVETTWTTADRVAEAVRPETALVIVETPANPTLALVDIRSVVEQAGDVAVLVDSTFATPVLQRPLDHGATLVLHSATKFLGGHGDVMGGVVATSDPRWTAALRQVRVLTGAVLHPLAGYLLHRGLATLPVRIRAAQEGAVTLAGRLAEHPSVERVCFPGHGGFHDGSPEDGAPPWLARQMSGPGTLVTFEVRGGFEAASTVMSDLELITAAVSLGSTDTLIQHPAAMTHRVVPEDAQREGGISPAMLRLSVGLEDPEDLWRDLAGALDRVADGERSTADAEPALAWASGG